MPRPLAERLICRGGCPLASAVSCARWDSGRYLLRIAFLRMLVALEALGYVSVKLCELGEVS